MKTNGKRKKRLAILFIVGCSIAATGTALGGNKWMMEKNAKELLLINEQLIDELAVVEENGEVEIRGRVIMYEGHPVLQLDKIRKIPAKGQLEQSVVDPALTTSRYKVFLREESLDEVPVVTEP